MRHLDEIAPGVLVATSPQYLTTTTVVLGDEGSLVVDPALTVDELDALAGELEGRGALPALGFSTHPHWDHVLWCRGLGPVSRYATADAVAAVERGRSDLAHSANQVSPGHDPALFGRLSALEAGPGSLAWEGPEAVVVRHRAHAPGHAAVHLPGPAVLIAGDMCSDVEIPLLDLEAEDPIADYRHGLAQLAAVAGVNWVVPGHGHVGDGAELSRRLQADRHYLDLLEEGLRFEDPRCQQAPWLEAEHDAQLKWALTATRGR